MGEIKSALEIAMEKIEKLGSVSEEERLKWKYVPEGKKLAARYIKGDGNLNVELKKYEENAKKYVIGGASEILVKNIDLPGDDLIKKNNKRAMEGLKSLKSDKIAVENVFSKIRRIFDHYAGEGEQQRRQAYESLKSEFGAKIQQAMQQQLGTSADMANMDIERQPQFQEEWRHLQTKLDLQYIKLLDEYKQELSIIT